MARSVKRLMRNHQDLSLIPHKKRLKLDTFITTSLGRQRQEDPWGTLARHSSLIREPQVLVREPAP